MLAAVGGALLGGVSLLNSTTLLRSRDHLEWKRVARAEDMEYRQELDVRWLIEDARFCLVSKSEQVKAVGEISALMALFSISALCEIHIYLHVHNTVLLIFGFLASLSVGYFFYVLMVNTVIFKVHPYFSVDLSLCYVFPVYYVHSRGTVQIFKRIIDRRKIQRI